MLPHIFGGSEESDANNPPGQRGLVGAVGVDPEEELITWIEVWCVGEEGEGGRAE